MKKIILIAIMAIAIISCKKDTFTEPTGKIIMTDFGSKMLTVNGNSNQTLTFTKNEWAEIWKSITVKQNGNSNESTQVFDDEEGPGDISLKEAGIKIKIKIATRKSNCSSGIGFRCGGEAGPYAKVELKEASQNYSVNTPNTLSNNGRNLDRNYDCFVKEINGSIVMEFLEVIDWNWLEQE